MIQGKSGTDNNSVVSPSLVDALSTSLFCSMVIPSMCALPAPPCFTFIYNSTLVCPVELSHFRWLADWAAGRGDGSVAHEGWKRSSRFHETAHLNLEAAWNYIYLRIFILNKR